MVAKMSAMNEKAIVTNARVTAKKKKVTAPSARVTVENVKAIVPSGIVKRAAIGNAIVEVRRRKRARHVKHAGSAEKPNDAANAKCESAGIARVWSVILRWSWSSEATGRNAC